MNILKSFELKEFLLKFLFFKIFIIKALICIPIFKIYLHFLILWRYSQTRKIYHASRNIIKIYYKLKSQQK